MENNINKLIQAYDGDNDQIGLFRITDNTCGEDYQDVIEEYFHLLNTDEVNADLYLFVWGLERVFIDFEIFVS